MDGFVVYPVPISVRTTRGARHADTGSVPEAEIDRLWDAAQQQMAGGGAGKLFNGRVLSIDTITATHIDGHMTEFRRIVAQMLRPVPPAVSGTPD